MIEERSRRLDKYERELRELSSQFFIQSGKRLGATLITVSRVKVSSDLRKARVFVSLLGSDTQAVEQDSKEVLELAGELGKFFGRNLRSKYTPSVSISLDEGFEKAVEIQNKINSISGR